MRMLRGGLQAIQVDYVHEADLERREVFTENRDRGERFHGHDVTGAGHDDVRFVAVVGTGPVPDSDALGAVEHCGLHIEIRQMGLLVRDDDVHIVLAA